MGVFMQKEGERQNNFFDVCGSCGSCCQGARPPLTARRRKIIDAYLKEQKLHISNPFVLGKYAFPREDAEGFCIFYDKKTRKCQIHPVKPETCVAGPVTFDISIPNRKIEWHLKMEKICQLAGIIYKGDELMRKHLESAKREIFRLVSELDSEALKAILKVEEPDTFKIGEDNIGKDVLDKIVEV
jgi:Fe-S-cluster containining protein